MKTSNSFRDRQRRSRRWIAAWDAKRHFDSARPVTAIRYYLAGKRVRAWAGPFQGTREISGEDWQPYQPTSVVTPPFSEFVSGHSTFSAASAEVLRRFTGSDDFGASIEIPAGSSRIEPGIVPARNITLSWRTFTDAADQAGMSRRYGGILSQREILKVGEWDARSARWCGRRPSALRRET